MTTFCSSNSYFSSSSTKSLNVSGTGKINKSYTSHSTWGMNYWTTQNWGETWHSSTNIKVQVTILVIYSDLLTEWAIYNYLKLPYASSGENAFQNYMYAGTAITVCHACKLGGVHSAHFLTPARQKTWALTPLTVDSTSKFLYIETYLWMWKEYVQTAH